MKLTVKGADKLMSALKANADPSRIKKVVRDNGAELENTMKRNASFSKGYQTGATKRSIKLDVKDNGLSAHVAPTTEYSPYLEYGTRFMSAQPFVAPSYNKQKKTFIDDLNKLVK